MEQMINAYMLVEKNKRKPLGRPMSRCEDSIKMDRNKTRGKDVDWIHLVQDAVQRGDLINTIMKLQVL
jgi:hypothetical protein